MAKIKRKWVFNRTTTSKTTETHVEMISKNLFIKKILFFCTYENFCTYKSIKNYLFQLSFIHETT